MRAEKKTLVKEDGRYLVFYHFEATADAHQTQAFEGLSEPAVQIDSHENIGSEASSEGIAGTLSNSKEGGATNV